MAIKSNFLDRLIERLNLLDSRSVQSWVLKLVREKGLLDTIFKTIREGVLIIDRDLKIHFANNAAVMLLGLPEDARERESQAISRYLKDLDWNALLCLESDESDRSSRQEIEVFYPSHRYLLLYVFPYENEFDDKADRGISTIVLEDVTEFRTKTESRIESETLRTVTMLAAGVAHEIGNPLNSLTIHLQLLERHFNRIRRDGNSEYEEAYEVLRIAIQEVQRLDTIINQFLHAIRPTRPEFQSISIKELVTETIAFMSREIEDRGIFVESEWHDVPRIFGDTTQLKQAFYNVIINAIQAMPKGGLLQIKLTEKSGYIMLTFADNGTGIARDELGNIFNPYYTSKEQGSGLGLMIVERIVREHDAELMVESEIDHGTVVTLKFFPHGRRTNLLEPHE